MQWCDAAYWICLFQVQGVQSLQGLQLSQGQGQAQQLTLAPVQTGQVGLPNLQTVTVNSATQSGMQYVQGDETLSPAGTTTRSTLRLFLFRPYNKLKTIPLLTDFLNHLVGSRPGPGIHIKEEPDSEEWQLSGDSTLNPSDLSNLRVQIGDDDMETQSGEGKRLRRVACTCPNCKESGGRWAFRKHTQR